MMQLLVLAILLAAVLLVACRTTPASRKEPLGTVIGAVVGGVIGWQVSGGSGPAVAALAGAVAGGLVGNAIGRRTDDTDRSKVRRAVEASRVGEPTSLRNADTGQNDGGRKAHS